MIRKYSDEDLQGTDPRIAYRLGKREVYLEMAEERKKEGEIMDMEIKQADLEIEVTKRRLGIG